VLYDDRSVKPMKAGFMRARIAVGTLADLSEQAPAIATNAIRLIVGLLGGIAPFGPPFSLQENTFSWFRARRP
jgi:hypothetical protein